jgi:6-phosphofructokinase 1
MLPTMAGATDRCVIPEHPFDIEHLCSLLLEDRRNNPSNYSVVLVSEGAKIESHDDMSFESTEADQFGHRKLGGIGDKVAAGLKEASAKLNNGRRVNVVNQRLSYLVRCGEPDAIDSVAPMAFGNLALDLILEGTSGRLITLHNGCYDSVPMETIAGRKKVVDVGKHYNTERLRPNYETFLRQPLFIMTSEA